MKLLFIMLPIFCSGCSVVNVVSEDVFDSLNDFRDTEVSRLVKYIDDDKSLSERDRNTFRIKLEHFDESLGALKKNSEKN